MFDIKNIEERIKALKNQNNVYCKQTSGSSLDITSFHICIRY